MRKNENIDLSSPITTQKCGQHFRNLSQMEKNLLTETQSNMIVTVIRIRISVVELGEVCKELIHMKYTEEQLWRHITNLFEKCMNGTKISREWKISFISTIRKKERKDRRKLQ